MCYSINFNAVKQHAKTNNKTVAILPGSFGLFFASSLSVNEASSSVLLMSFIFHSLKYFVHLNTGDHIRKRYNDQTKDQKAETGRGNIKKENEFALF